MVESPIGDVSAASPSGEVRFREQLLGSESAHLKATEEKEEYQLQGYKEEVWFPPSAPSISPLNDGDIPMTPDATQANLAVGGEGEGHKGGEDDDFYEASTIVSPSVPYVEDS